ncbi:MAG: hypothetical protein PUB10_07075 [Clostridiales bacterium]|nr:hypothetical protein [Clostridiales bacterium]
MELLRGVYQAAKKDGTVYYRSSITFHGKHISLGSYPDCIQANEAYRDAGEILAGKQGDINDPNPFSSSCLSFEKQIVLMNFRDNQYYIKTPIYLKKKYFLYYLSPDYVLTFDADDLFYYSNHKIMQRGGHLFVSDFGMQVNILSRYGIKNYGVAGKDYRFVNGDPTDFRYRNIEIITRYHGVDRIMDHGLPRYQARIHINGDYIIGRYDTETEAAAAYNKAAAYLKEKGCTKNFPKNYLPDLDAITYASLYNKIRISPAIRKLTFT